MWERFFGKDVSMEAFCERTFHERMRVCFFLGGGWGIGKMVEAPVLELTYISLGDVKCLSSKYLVLSTPLTFRLFLPTEW